MDQKKPLLALEKDLSTRIENEQTILESSRKRYKEAVDNLNNLQNQNDLLEAAVRQNRICQSAEMIVILAGSPSSQNLSKASIVRRISGDIQDGNTVTIDGDMAEVLRAGGPLRPRRWSRRQKILTTGRKQRISYCHRRERLTVQYRLSEPIDFLKAFEKERRLSELPKSSAQTTV